ncbi:MAG: PilZ domain-containing protein [Devosiaceae bacterium]|nr:PilZ domain-containing protein [Devosiaceae bacterium]
MFELQDNSLQLHSQAELNADPDRFQSVKLSILGRYMLADYSEYPCQIVEMSPGEARIIAPVSGTLDMRIVAYLDDIGRIDGKIIRVFEGGFIVGFLASARKRDKIAAQLTWLANKDILGLEDERDSGRFVPDFRHSKIVLDDGREYNCKLLDISISGAAIELSVRPAMGSIVTLGRMQAKVVRHFENGIGVQFSSTQEMLSIVQQNLRLD